MVAGLLGFGSYMLLEKSEAKEKTEESQAQDAKQTEQDHAALDKARGPSADRSMA